MGPNDTSAVVVDHHDHRELRSPIALCAEFMHPISSQITEIVPGLRYWEMTQEQREYTNERNIVGYQQRAWDFYWCVREGMDRGQILLGIGTAGVQAPACFTTDKYAGVAVHPDYGSPSGQPYAPAHMVLNADVFPWPFMDGMFGGVISNHAFEHILNQEAALLEMFRVTKPGGVVAIVMPDMTYHPRGGTDKSHTHEFSADEFFEWFNLVLEESPYKYDVIEHNTFANKFSFNTVFRKQ